MSRLTWDNDGERFYETGVSQGVLYPKGNNGYEKGVAWNGLTAVNESPEGAETTDLWADDIKYLQLVSAENYKATIEAYTYPDEFAQCDGSAELETGVYINQQVRKPFGFCYKTIVGNDNQSNDYGYKLHVVYGAQAAPSEKSYSTVNDSPEAITFSWEVNTTPVPVEYGGVTYKPTASVVIDTTKLQNGKENTNLKLLEDILYGKDPSSVNANDGTDPTLITPSQIAQVINTGSYT